MSFRMKKNGKGSPAPSGTPGSNGSFTEDEYYQIIEGVKRTYNQKIRPLEVTYNFEGLLYYFFSLFMKHFFFHLIVNKLIRYSTRFSTL